MTKTVIQSLILGSTLLSAANTNASIQTINFDTDAFGNDIAAPTLFSAATPLTDLYSSSGVTFSALSRTQQTSLMPKDGIEVSQTYNVMNVSGTGMGSILDQASNFGNNAKSGNNFLAFNNQSDSSANFWRISFDNPIGYFGISYSAGSTSGYQYLNFQAYDINGDLIGGSYSNYLGNYSSYQSNYWDNAFRSETEISYIDIGQGLYCCSNNLNASLKGDTWSLNFDDLIYGNFTDAPAYVYNLSGNGVYVPLPASVWIMLSGLAMMLGTKRRGSPS